MPTFKTTLILLGVECNVEVEYTIKTVGSPTTYSPVWGADGGDPDEIDILHIWIGDKDYLKELGNCYMFDECDKYTGFSFSPVAYLNPPERYKSYNWQDKIRIAMFGLVDNPIKGDNSFLPIQTNVRYVGDTVYERLEAKILESEALQAAIYDLDRGCDFD